MGHFALDKQWEDPFEPRQERRGARRFAAGLRVSLEVLEPGRGKLVGPGLVEDLSTSGLALVTKHQLEPDRRVTIQFSTESCPNAMSLPTAITGSARVVRVKGVKGTKRSVALTFCDDLTKSMDFALFVNQLGVSRPAYS